MRYKKRYSALGSTFKQILRKQVGGTLTKDMEKLLCLTTILRLVENPNYEYMIKIYTERGDSLVSEQTAHTVKNTFLRIIKEYTEDQSSI